MLISPFAKPPARTVPPATTRLGFPPASYREASTVLVPRRLVVKVLRWTCVVLVLLGGPALRADEKFAVTPETIQLDGNFARAQLIVSAVGKAAQPDERSTDLTHNVVYKTSNPAVVS